MQTKQCFLWIPRQSLLGKGRHLSQKTWKKRGKFKNLKNSTNKCLKFDFSPKNGRKNDLLKFGQLPDQQQVRFPTVWPLFDAHLNANLDGHIQAAAASPDGWGDFGGIGGWAWRWIMASHYEEFCTFSTIIVYGYDVKIWMFGII